MKPFSGFTYYMVYEIAALNRLLYREKESDWEIVFAILIYANSNFSMRKIARNTKTTVYRVRKVKKEYGEFFHHHHWYVLLPFLASVEKNAFEERYGSPMFLSKEEQRRARFCAFLEKAIDY